MSGSHSGTIGRARGQSVGGSGSGSGSGSGGGGHSTSSSHINMRRQRSVEWHHDRNHGYSSGEETAVGGALGGGVAGHGTVNPGFDSQLLAQLIAQSQQLSSKCKDSICFLGMPVICSVGS